jgi:predicted DNA-binding transcriptional regulator YafY
MPSQQDTIKRQWHMLRLIPRAPAKITARDLHSRLLSHGYDIKKRTIERDLIDLSTVFPLIADDRERPFGWSWKKDAPTLDIPRLTPEEALALKLMEQYLKGLLPLSVVDQLRPHFDAASHVLEEERTISKTSAWLKKIAVVQPTQPLLPPKQDPKIERAVYDALLREKQMQIRYQRKPDELAEKPADQRQADHRIHPLGLVQRGAATYLVVTIDPHKNPRILALHRIKAVEVLDDSIEPPAGFSLQRYIADGAFGFGQTGEKIKLVLCMEKDAATHLYETALSTDQTIEADGPQHVRVSATVHDNPQLERWIRGFGKQARRIQ